MQFEELHEAERFYTWVATLRDKHNVQYNKLASEDVTGLNFKLPPQSSWELRSSGLLRRE